MTIPAGHETRKRLILLQFRTTPRDMGTLIAYQPGPRAAHLAWQLHQAYVKQFGGPKSDVQPPYRAFETVLRAVTGDWARMNLSPEHLELLTASPIAPEDRRDVFNLWAEAILPSDEGREIARELADLLAGAPESTDIQIPDSPASRRSRTWWPGQLTRWRLAQRLAAQPWDLGHQHPVIFTLCTDGTLAALGHELDSAPRGQHAPRHLLARIRIGVAATGHSTQPALTVTAATSLLATTWYGVRTVLLANPGQKIAVAAHTGGPAWDRRLNVPAVAASRRLAALPRLSRSIPPFPEHLQQTQPGPIRTDPDTSRTGGDVRGPWAIAPVSTKTPELGRGNGMEMFRRIEKHMEDHCETLHARSPVYIEVPSIALSPLEAKTHPAGPIAAQDLPAALDAARIENLLLIVLWHTQGVRSRLQAEIARHWEFGERFVARERQIHHALGGRAAVVFVKDAPGALRHGPASVKQRQQQFAGLLAPYVESGHTLCALAETDWDPDIRYPSEKARRAAEALDGKFPSKQALSTLGISVQYVNADPPPVRTTKANGDPYSDKYIAYNTTRRNERMAHSTTAAARDLLRGLGVIDHRLGTAFGNTPLPSYWHVGIHVRRHAPHRIPGLRNTTQSPRMSIAIAAIHPTGDKTRPWTAWAYCLSTHRWQPYRTAQLAQHAAEPGIDPSTHPTIGDEAAYAVAAAVITEEAITAARTQLPYATPTVVYIDGDSTETIWRGVADENIGAAKPDSIPRDASWLPGHGLPAAQRPLAIVRVITDLERIGRPVGAKAHTNNGWIQQDTTHLLFQLVADTAGTFAPDFLLCNKPRAFLGGNRTFEKETRFATGSQGKQGEDGYAHTATRFTVIPTREDADTDLIAKAAAILTNQAIAWVGRQSRPTPLRLAKQIDTEHPYYRRTVPEDDQGQDDGRTLTPSTSSEAERPAEPTRERDATPAPAY